MSSLVLLHGFTGGPESFDRLLGMTSGLRAQGGGVRGGEGTSAGAREGGAPSRDRRIVRPWLAGHGPAPILVDSWDAEIGRLARHLREVGVAGAHLVGYSLGGRVALGLLAQAPAHFSRATLIGAHPGLHEARDREARREADARWIGLLEHDGVDAFVAAWEALPLWSTQSRTTREAQRPIRRSHTAAGLAHALRVLGLAAMPPVDPRAITTPIQLVIGEHDAKHRAIAETFAPRVGARVHVVPGAGHNVLAEAPEALAELLR